MANFSLSPDQPFQLTMDRLSESSKFLNPNVKLVTSARVALQLAFLCLFLSTLVPSLMIVLHRRMLFASLPQLPKMGVIGRWLLGNIDIYFYSMRHLTIEEAIHETTNGLLQIESVRKEGLFACHLGPIPTVAFFRADTVGQLMSSSSGNNKQTAKAAKTTQTSKGDQFRFLRPWLGQGLIISEGEHWRRHRKLINPSFSPVVLRSFLPSFNSNVNLMLSRVANSTSATALDLRPLVKDLALDIVTETTLGRAVGAQLEGTNREEYIEPVSRALACFANRLMNPLHHLDLLFRFSSEGRQNESAVRKIHQYVRKVVDERKGVRREKGDYEDRDKQQKRLPCFLDLLLKAHQENPADFTERDILEEVNALMFAGQDSTSVAMTMTLALVAGDQRVQALIIKELETIFAGEADPLRCPITGEHCQQMKYLEAVLKESLRLYSPAPNTAKKIEEEEGIIVNGHVIPKGTSALILYSLMHRDSAVFPQPDRFIPERFLEEEDCSADPSTFPFHLPRPVPNGAFIPFSTGPRVCLGIRYALLEMKLVLAAVLRRYHLTAVTPRDSIRFGIAVVLTIRSPVMVRFEERRKGLFAATAAGN